MTVRSEGPDARDTAGVLAERKGGVLWLSLNRPRRLNAVTAPMLDELTNQLDAAAAAPDVRAVVLTGVGRAFCAGADLHEEHKGGRQGSLQAAQRTVTALLRIDKPVLTAVNGPAVGVGCALALAGDVIVARADAYFLLAFRQVGVPPDGGLLALLPATIGRVRTLGMALLAERVPAPTAADWGLVTRAVRDTDPEPYDAVIANLAESLATGPTLAYGRTKQAVDDVFWAGLATAFDREVTAREALLGSYDRAEGIAAFREGRAPRFRGY